MYQSQNISLQISCANMKQILKPVELHEIGLLCQKRLTSLPIQYVIEEWDFAGLNLRMNPPVFIPRPETHVSTFVICSHYFLIV